MSERSAPIHAVILAGGRGTRLRPYTATIPKPLVPLGEHSILEIILRQLRKAGIRSATLAVSHMAELIMAFCGNGERFGLEIGYSIEETPRGTVGGLTDLPNLPDNFLVMNGDVLTDLDFAGLFDWHVANGALLTVATCRRRVPTEFGVVTVDPDSHRIAAFAEKPVYHLDVSMGVYVFARETVSIVPTGGAYGFDQLVLQMLASKKPIHAYEHRGYWLDLGRPEDYDIANRDYDRILPRDAFDETAASSLRR